MRLAIVAAICASLAAGQEVKRPRLTGVAHIGLYDKFPSLTQFGVLHHIGLLDSDMSKVAARLEAQPGRKAYTRPIDVRGTRRQIQVYDPDGTRTEAMEPIPADAPLVNCR